MVGKGWTSLRWSRGLLLVLLLLFLTSPGIALQDRILILPPSNVEGSKHPSRGRTWEQLIAFYQAAVLGYEPILPYEMIAAWGGDTLDLDFHDIDEATRWGEQLEADVVLLSEWEGEGGELLHLQSVDIFTHELRGPVEGNGIVETVFLLEPEKFLFNTSLTDPRLLPGDYHPPAFLQDDREVHRLMHQSRSYPPDLLIQGRSGTADVKVDVSRQGVALGVALLKVRPQGEGFEIAFEQALWKLTYRPATYNGQSVNAVWRTRFRVDPIP